MHQLSTWLLWTTTQPACRIHSPAIRLQKGKRPGPAAAFIGQEAGFSVSSSKWRHVRGVRLQLGPDYFPEALESSPCISAHRGRRRVHPTVSGPDLSWHEKVLSVFCLILRAHAGKECYTQTGMQTLTRNPQPVVTQSRKYLKNWSPAYNKPPRSRKRSLFQ